MRLLGHGSGLADGGGGLVAVRARIRAEWRTNCNETAQQQHDVGGGGGVGGGGSSSSNDGGSGTFVER